VAALDFPDWTIGYGLVSGSGDFPDWTNGVTIVPGPLAPTGDNPDWTKTVIEYTTVVVDPNTPLGVPGLGAWWKADTITGFADGASLTAWPDSSGNGHPLAQSGGNPVPVFYSSTVGKTINGFPAVWFTAASSEELVTPSSIAIAQPLTTFVVFHASSLSANGEFVGVNNVVAGLASTSFYAVNAGTLLSGGAPDLNLHLGTFTLNGASSSIRVDRTVVASGNAGTTTPGTHPVWLGTPFGGGVNFWNGAVAEVILYPSIALSAAQVSTIESYLRLKWGTP
jgi:hypothetical protein